MRNVCLFALLSVAGISAGCSSIPSATPYAEVNKVLDAMLPADFTGPIHIEHANVYFDITIDADGLKRTEKGWTWTWLRTKRHDRFSNGSISLGKPL